MQYLLGITLFLLQVGATFAQPASDTIRIPPEYEFSKQKPIEVQSGTIIFNECSELLLLNRDRFEFYEELRATIPIIDSLEKHIFLLDGKITEKENAFDALAEQCKESTGLNEELEKRITGIMDGMDTALTKTNDNLLEAQKSLQEANRLMKTGRRKKIFDRLLIGAGGFVVGTLGTLLISN